MIKEQIKLELEKETPNYLLISNLALQLHDTTLESNYFKFKKGKLNVLKTSKYNTDVIQEALEACINGDDYKYICVGSYKGMTVTKYNRLIDELINEVNTKYVVVITDKEQVITNSLRKGMLINPYNTSIRHKYDKVRPTQLTIKGEDFELKCDMEDENSLKAYIRDIKLVGLGL